MPLDFNNPDGELVIDPHRNRERYHSLGKTIPGISRENEAIITQYLEDIRQGVNINPRAVKGRRGYHRLITQRHRLKRMAQLLEATETPFLAPMFPEAIAQLEKTLRTIFEGLEDGTITKDNGDRYKSVKDYIKGFKAFRHWYMTLMKRERDIRIPDITEYLCIKDDRKPKFVYFGTVGGMSVEEGFRRLMDDAKARYKPVMAFMFDSGIRCPTELANVKRKDITRIRSTPFYWLTIRDETAKTFGRRIKLMLCHDVLHRYLEDRKFEPDDFLFTISPGLFNQYLKRLGDRVLGKKGITLYDFRHNAASFFLPRYKSENALLYRFGWKDSRMIHYYTERLGMCDTLSEDDFMVDRTRSEIERELDFERRQRATLDEEVAALRDKLASMTAVMEQLMKDVDGPRSRPRRADELHVARG